MIPPPERPPRRARARLVARRPDPAWFTLVLLANGFLHAAVYAVRPLAAYQALALHAGPAGVGVVASAFALLSLFLALPAGRWVDRWGEPPFIVLGCTLAAAGAVAASLAGSVAVLAATQAALGLGHLLAVVASQTLIANRTEDAVRDDRVGVYTVMASLGQLAGPALAGAVLGTGPGRRLLPGFLLGAGLALFAALVALRLSRDARRRGGPTVSAPSRVASSGPPRARPCPRLPRARRGIAARLGESARETARLLLRPGMPPAMVSSLTVLSSIDILSAYLPVLGDLRGLSVSTVGLLLSLRGAMSMVSRLFMAALLRRMSRAVLLFWSMAVPALAVAGLPWVPGVGGVAVLMAAAGLGLGLGQPLTMSWVASRAPENQRGAALGLRLSGNRLGQLALPAAVGAIGDAVGESAVFWTVGLALLAAALWVVRAPFGEDARPREAPGGAA